jgi:hypothetical protein
VGSRIPGLTDRANLCRASGAERQRRGGKFPTFPKAGMMGHPPLVSRPCLSVGDGSFDAFLDVRFDVGGEGLTGA